MIINKYLDHFGGKNLQAHLRCTIVAVRFASDLVACSEPHCRAPSSWIAYRALVKELKTCQSSALGELIQQIHPRRYNLLGRGRFGADGFCYPREFDRAGAAIGFLVDKIEHALL